MELLRRKFAKPEKQKQYFSAEAITYSEQFSYVWIE